MKQQSLYGRVGTKSERLRRWVVERIEDKKQRGETPTGIRYLFYEAVTERVVLKKGKKGGRRADQDLAEATTWVRKHDFIDWDDIDDRTRRVIDYTGNPTLRSVVERVIAHARLSRWEKGRTPVIIVESESTASALEGIAYEYRVPLIPLRGQSAGFVRTKVAPFIEGPVCYVGDWDRSGHNIEKNTQKVLEEVLKRELGWKRVALTEAQVQQYGLEVFASLDRRDGKTSPKVEAEALGQVRIVEAMRVALEALGPESEESVQVREERERHALRRKLGIQEDAP